MTEERRVRGWDKPMANRLSVGLGSRGGTFHLDPPAYYRGWRRSHPDYTQRERERSARRRAVEREAKAVERIAFREAILVLIARDVLASSKTEVAVRLATTPQQVGIWLRFGKGMSGDIIDAAVTLYGLRQISRAMRTTRTVAMTEIEEASRRDVARMPITTCRAGHAVEGENVSRYRRNGRDRQRCRACANARKREHWGRARRQAARALSAGS